MINSIVLFFLILEAVLALWLLYRDGLIKKPWAAVVCAVLMAVVLALRASVFDMETGDYRDFITRWVSYYRDNGGFRAFGQLPPYCNYQVPYLYFLALFSYSSTRDLYLVKLLSVLFDIFLAWGCAKLLGRVSRSRALRLACFFTVLFWPTVFLNGAVWGQCDSIYAAFAVIGLWMALEGKPSASMAMMALSFSFKLQAVFVLPICAVLLICGKYRWKHLLVFPLTYFLALLPAVLLGRPLWDTLSFYFTQTGTIGAGLNYNSPSIFAIFWHIPADQQPRAALIAIGAAVLYLLNLLGLAWIKRKELTDRAVIALALLMANGIPFLLPHMHDRYFYTADVLAVVLAFALPPLFLTAPLVGFASFLGYYAYLSFYFSERGGHYLIGMWYGSYALLAALLLSFLGFLSSLSRRGSGGKRRARSPAK